MAWSRTKMAGWGWPIGSRTRTNIPGDSVERRWRAWDYRSAPHRQAARVGVHLVIDEVDVPLVRKSVLVLQPHEDGNPALLISLHRPFVDRLADTQHRPLVNVEIDVHRVQRYDRRQQCLILNDQVAQSQEIAANLAVDRRSDFGEAEIQLVDLQACLKCLDRRVGLVHGRLVLV